jgi:hypothetical protein
MASAKAKTTASAKAPKTYSASLHTSRPLTPEFAAAIKELETKLGLPVWMFIQEGKSPEATLGHEALRFFLNARADLAKDGPIALVIDSPGGLAPEAYKIARLLNRHCGGFTAVVPTYAKSAATLLALGAEVVMMGADAEMGPLDAQLWDTEREERASALDEVQALERLHSVALEQLDETMITLVAGTAKRTDVLLPIACGFVSEMMAPLLDKIDTVHYAKQSRVLKVAQDYLERLLIPHYGSSARDIADRLVNHYPEHGFVIDRTEMGAILGRDLEPPDEAKDAIETLDERLLTEPAFVAIGKLEEK